jgi:type IV secretion system protein TrbC
MNDNNPHNDRFANGVPAPRASQEDASRTYRLRNKIRVVWRGGRQRDRVALPARLRHDGWPSLAQRIIRHLTPILVAGALTAVALLATCSAASAAGSGMPWEAPMQRILESIEGPVAKIIAVIVIIVTGLSLAFGDMSGAFRRMVQVVFGLSIAFAATSFFLSFFAFAGGALIE